MNNLLAASLALTLLTGTGLAAPPKAGPIVVELFTSEGCSSCPPADALLSKLRQAGTIDGAEVLILGEHVDYWNHLGWTDRFSSAAFSERQNEYARRFDLNSAYTPQMVIDGHAELVGNDEGGVHRQIALAARSIKPAQIKLSWNADGKLHVDIDGTSETDGKVLLAITEDGLSTQVGRGENGGRLLQHNGVVRELREIGSVHKGRFSSTMKASLQADWKPENLRAVVFVQKPGHGDVIGAASLAYAHSK
jgi:hypothetical protein